MAERYQKPDSGAIGVKGKITSCKNNTGNSESIHTTKWGGQLDACKKLAQERGYEVLNEFIITETYSGLSLDRPELTKLWDIVKDNLLDSIIAYTPGRLCWNGEDNLGLAKEFRAYSVKLIFVKERWDDTLNGTLPPPKSSPVIMLD